MKRTISGIRGIFGKDLDLKDVLWYCGNFSSLVGSKRCAVGRDTRQSGQMVLETAKAALMKNGIKAYDMGIVPTPVVFYEARRLGAGVVATASHNPLCWNGLKFALDGRGVNNDELPRILESQDAPETGIGGEQPHASTYLEDASALVGDIESGPDVLVDLGGGAARNFAPNLLRMLGCKVRTINNTISQSSRGPDPTSESLDELASMQSDIGFAFDLDADRLVVVKDGKKQSPDTTLGLGVAKSIKLGCKKFVLSTDTSVAVERLIRESGCTVQRSKVGEANVIDMMAKSGAQAGGEGSSGGFILPEFNCCRDGILASGLVASMLDDPEFGHIMGCMQNHYQAREAVDVDAKHHDLIIEKISEKMQGESSQISRLDGIKGVIDEDNWILIRKSNTQDSIRVSAESDSQDRCKSRVNGIIKLVNRYYEQVR